MSFRAPSKRIFVNFLVDSGMAALATPLALWIALSHSLPHAEPWYAIGGIMALQISGIPFRLSRQFWRFASIQDLLALTCASIIAAVLFSGSLAILGISLPSMSFPLAHALSFIAMLGAPRVFYRAVRGVGLFGHSAGTEPERVLVIGAGQGADLFLRAASAEQPPRHKVVGLVAVSSANVGRLIQGVPILGDLSTLGETLDRLAAEGSSPAALVLVEESLGAAATDRLLDEAGRRQLGLLRAAPPAMLKPATQEVTSLDGPAGSRGVQSRLAQNPAIELKPLLVEDLLDRAQVPLDRDGMARLIQGRRVLVTGAGGTIGSELAKQVAALGPEMLILLDNGEFALWQIDLELTEAHPTVQRRTVVADIRDETRIRAIIMEARPELVFHAAALKHVPLVESNPLEGLQTNAVGTKNVADAARAAGALAMVLISTDKAVNPTSVMGASKRLAEQYCQALDIAARRAALAGQPSMRCVTVRFGNVLGSTGSVVPLFLRQLERGGPLTVTHPDMQRYFMTVREAVGLVLQASVAGVSDADGPETVLAEGGIFVLDMGKPVKIVDLARQIIRLAGLRPEVDVQIRYTGLRAGEKLHEEMFHGTEPPVPTSHQGLLMAVPRTADPAIVGRALQEIATACRAGNRSAALAVLARMVPEFAPTKAAPQASFSGD